MQRRALALSLLSLAVVLAAASGKRHIVTQGADVWFERHYDGANSMPNECNANPTCYGGGTYAAPEAALQATVDDLETAFGVYPHAAILLSFVSGPPGSDYTRKWIKTRGIVEELVARYGALPAQQRPQIQIETRADVAQVAWRPSQPTLDARYNRSAIGCPHGTASHWHRETGPEATADEECGWPAVGLCADSKDFCRCWGADGQLDGDGTCVDALDTDCPASTCTLTPLNPAWILTAPDAEVAAAMATYEQVYTTGRVDIFCDGIARTNESDCDLVGDPDETDPSTERLVADGERARPYVYRDHYDFDFGGSTGYPGGADGFTSIGAPMTVTSSTSTETAFAGASPEPGELVGGLAYVRIEALSDTWESRDITANTATTVTVSPAWTDPPDPGESIALNRAGSVPRAYADVSGVMIDLSEPDARSFMAALPFAIAYDLGVPADWPLVVAIQTKFGYWTIAPPDDAVISAPCRTFDDSFIGANPFVFPTPRGGQGLCEIGGSNPGPLGNPWPARGEYEGLWNAVAQRVLAQIPTSHYAGATMASVSTPARNRRGANLGGFGTWDGLATAVHRHPLYLGSRWNEVTPELSFPFAEPACRDGADNDGDSLIDLADPGCADASDLDETNAPLIACSNGLDDDGDGSVDLADPGCSGAADPSEQNNAVHCDDGLDNDGDTLADFPADPGCSSLLDLDETEVCSNGLDDDVDGAVDFPADTGCSSAADTDERGSIQCDDGADNDGDGLVDFPADTGCTSIGDGSEVFTPASLTAEFVATKMQDSTTCVAPCAVFFDAIGDGTNLTRDTDYSREFHTLAYRWDFGDPDAGVWKTGAMQGASRNYDEGGVAGHLYTRPGTYTVTLTARAPDGEEDTYSLEVVVADPDLHFAATTFCVSSSGTFAGCTGTQITTADLDVALFGAAGSGYADVDQRKVRVRFRGGETFTSDTASPPAMGAHAGPGLVDSFGNGMAHFEGPTSGQIATIGPGWTVTNVETNHNAAASTSTWLFPGTSTSTHGVALIATRCLDNGNYCASTSGGSGDSGSPFNVAIIDNVTEADDSELGADPGSFFLRHNQILLLGNDLGGHSDYQTRTVHVNKAVFGHNTYSIIPATGPCGADPEPCPENAFQLRSCDDSGLSCGGTTQKSRWILIANNRFRQSQQTDATIKIVNNSVGAESGSGLGGVSDVVIERNFSEIVPSAYADPSVVGGLVGWHAGVDVTVRNNVVDVTGMRATAPATIVNFSRPPTAPPTPPSPQTGVEVYNNTLVSTTAGSADVTLCAGSANLVAAKCYGNLAYVPNLDQENQADGANWTTANNVFASANPFIATPPAQGTARIDDYNVVPGSAADGTGYAFTGSGLWNQLDAGGCRRSAPWDAGAWQIGATGCLETDSLIGINSEKMLVNEEAIIFPDAIDNTAQIRVVADPATSTYESFTRSYREDLTTLESAIAIPANDLGWPSVPLPWDPDGAGPLPRVVARIDVMQQQTGRPHAYPTGTYTLAFTGTGEVRVSGGGAVTCAGTNASCPVAITPTSTGTSVWITGSDALDPITDVSLLLPGYTTADRFYWPTVVRLRPFGFIRSLNFTRANDYECSNLASGEANARLPACVHTWASRTKPGGIQASRRGISWERQIELAEAAQVGFWPNIPHAADDTYVSTLAEMLRASRIRLLLPELGNENWNEGDFAQGWYWINVGDAAGFGTASPCSSLGAPGSPAVVACLEAAQVRAYLERAADVADLFDSVFVGADAPRLVKVLGTFTGSTAFTSGLIAAINSSTYNPTGATFDAIALGPYFTGTGGSVTAILDSAEANVAALEAYIDAQAALIHAANLEVFAYEGGPLIEGMDANSIAANDDPRMEQIVEDFFALWFANGGRETAAGFFMRDHMNGGVLRYPTQSIDAAPRYRGFRGAIDAAPQP